MIEKKDASPGTKIDLFPLEEISVLYVEDDCDVHKQTLEFLGMHFRHVYSAFDGRQGLMLFQEKHPDVVLTDIRMPVMDGLDMAAKIKELQPNIPVIVITAYYEAEYLIKAIDIGIDKYVTKPTDGGKLLEAIYKCVLPLLQKKEIESLNAKIFTTLENRISKSPRMKESIHRLQKVANSDFSVIIYGETGVGKSYVARIIHDLSKRASQPFITIDIGAIPETLVESELFGHTRGAFTGADKAKKGFFEIANGGTLFLEDLENMTPYVQSKLLRAVEDKKIFPIGSTTPVDVNIRIIGATNKNIFDEVHDKKFREDLFYRMCEFDLHILPLRERPEDIPYLATKFVSEVSAELDKNIIDISKDAMTILKKHTWQGNVRELKNVMRRVVLLSESELIEKTDVLRVLNTNRSNHEGNSNENETTNPTNTNELSLSSSVELAEKHAILKALEKTNRKKLKTAELLNIDYKTLVTKMEKYGIS